MWWRRRTALRPRELRGFNVKRLVSSGLLAGLLGSYLLAHACPRRPLPCPAPLMRVCLLLPPHKHNYGDATRFGIQPDFSSMPSPAQYDKAISACKLQRQRQQR